MILPMEIDVINIKINPFFRCHKMSFADDEKNNYHQKNDDDDDDGLNKHESLSQY